MSKLEVLEWALIGVEERLGYFLKVSERNELNDKRDYLMYQITIQEDIERGINLNNRRKLNA